MKKIRVTILTLTLVFAAVFAIQAQEDAKTLFRQNCASCHSIEQNLVGPALKGLTDRRDSAWIYSFIKNSQEMIQAGDPIAVELFNKFNKVPMPAHPHLTNEQIGAILEHINSESAPAAVAGTVDAHPIQRPDEFYGANYRQFTFGDMLFWIPMTITVLLLIATLMAFTHANDNLKNARKETVVPQEEL